MSSWFILIAYILFAYGMSVIVTQGIGPFNIFFRLRTWADSVSDNFGMLFRCMLCYPTNLGIVFSLVNWFLLPIAITPFNMLFEGHESMWWIAAIMDGCLTGGVCHFIWNVDDYFSKNVPVEYEEDNQEDTKILLND